jgi:hypothetical protein
VSGVRLWRVLLGVEEHVVIEAVELVVCDEGEAVVAAADGSVREPHCR